LIENEIADDDDDVVEIIHSAIKAARKAYNEIMYEYEIYTTLKIEATQYNLQGEKRTTQVFEDSVEAICGLSREKQINKNVKK